MKPFHCYNLKSTKIPPAKEDFYTAFAYDEGECIFKGSKREYDEDYQMLKALYPNHVVQCSYDRLGYGRSLAAYEQDILTAREQFKQDLFTDSEVINSFTDTLKNYLYSKAVEMAPKTGCWAENTYLTFMHLVDVACVARCTK